MSDSPDNEVVKLVQYVIPYEWVTNNSDKTVHVFCNNCEAFISRAQPDGVVKGHTGDECLVCGVMSA